MLSNRAKRSSLYRVGRISVSKRFVALVSRLVVRHPDSIGSKGSQGHSEDRIRYGENKKIAVL